MTGSEITALNLSQIKWQTQPEDGKNVFIILTAETTFACYKMSLN
jgi:hypothetical protein